MRQTMTVESEEVMVPVALDVYDALRADSEELARVKLMLEDERESHAKTAEELHSVREKLAEAAKDIRTQESITSYYERRSVLWRETAKALGWQEDEPKGSEI